MSYLSPLRLHFSGKFQANVSTVNNDPTHFDNATFEPSFQEMQTNVAPNGWFNPQGDAAFRLLGCKITSAWIGNGGAAASSDPVLSCLIADSGSRVPAKLVDLDSEQQLVSQIWGLQVRITARDGHTLMRGNYEPAAFMDIWDRATGGGNGDIGAGAMYQSVLTQLEWGDVTASPMLQALRGAAKSGLLSIKFNVDGLNMDFKSPDFMCGRIVGTIGPALDGEPRHMLRGRQLMARESPKSRFFTPVGGINFFAAVLDQPSSSVLLDLGNALSTRAPGEELNDLGDLTLSAYDPASPDGPAAVLGLIPARGKGGYTEKGWYEATAGVVAVPLSQPRLDAIASVPLMVSGQKDNAVIREWPSGAFVRADNFVHRLSPGAEAKVAVYATQWGRPLENASVTFEAYTAMLQGGDGELAVATPGSALTFASEATTNAQGVAMLSLRASDPGMPRRYIDGQVYGVRPLLGSQYTDPSTLNQWSFISVLIWSEFKPTQPVTWHGCLEPIFQQYANLYPIMLRFLDLGDYESVRKNLGLLTLAFGLDPSDPNSMPVTRDLSPAKRAAILAWMKDPQLGTAPALKVRAAAEKASLPGLEKLAPMGGKAAAAARRLAVTRKVS